MGRPPVPLSQFILKVHGSCDLACDHCYVYESADQSWRKRRKVISDEVVTRAAERIAEHAGSHELEAVQVVLHGGEPLLARPAKLGRIATELESALRGVCRLDLRIHTNGVSLDEQFCELFAEHDVSVSISVDGDRAANDRHRLYAGGRSSYDKVLRAIELLRTGRFRDLYAGLLCTIDLANDPLVVYESLMDLDPPRIDFLLPHATWEQKPARTVGADSEYADWLIAIFDRWLAEGRPTQVRTFDSVISTLRGGDSFTEALGLGPAGLVVIETDGSYEQVDSLKVASDGAPDTGKNVHDHAIDEVLGHPSIRARQQGIAGLCQTCRECPVVTSCGGGLYTHRYRNSGGSPEDPSRDFANPSVYCSDLLKLISHISSRLPEVPDASQESPAHVLSGKDFRTLAAGLGDAAAMTSLIEAQHSLLRGLLGAVYSTAVTMSPEVAPAGEALGVAWSLLATLDREQPKALGTVLEHPYVRAWAMRCLAQLKTPAAWSSDEDRARAFQRLAVDLGHLGAIAAAAAIRARTGAAVTVPVVDDAVHLPTLGRLVLGTREAPWSAESDPGTATVNVIRNAVIVRVGENCWTLDLASLLAGDPCAVEGSGHSGFGEWQPVRTLRAGGTSVALEDTDPFRDCYPWKASSRLTEAEFARWQYCFQEAWQEISREHRAYGPALGAGLKALVPVDDVKDGRDVNTTTETVFGAVGASLPGDTDPLALLLIREFQRVKLGAILDLYNLYDPADDRLFGTPWEDGKSQLEGLLRGTYAHLAVADFWRARQHRSGGQAARAAGERFRQEREDTRQAIEALLDSGSLTQLGTWFVLEMRHSVSL
jgi:uncharacterized protein